MNSMQYRNVTAELSALDEKIKALLPPQYEHCYSDVSPNSMGSAGLVYDRDGKVAWDRIWTSFCDLALAGGPPHRGHLLEPVSEAEVANAPTRYREVVAEIDRAIRLTTGLNVVNGYAPGWIGLQCWSIEEAAWLQFAVTAENVSARRRHAILQVPAGPDFRVQKEIKNVVVALAKSCHYWDGHLTSVQQSLAAGCVCEPATPAEAAVSPAEYDAALAEVESGLLAAGLPTSPRQYVGWIGVETSDDEAAVWMLRAILVEQVLARREGRVIYLPVGATPNADQAAHVGNAFRRAWELWTASSRHRPTWRP